MSCPFCVESAIPQFANTFLGSEWPYVGRTVLSSRDAFVVPGYGPQVYPYLLVVTRRHFPSLTEASGDEVAAIIACLQRLQASQLFESPSLCIFEHGGCAARSNACIDHCHLHVVDDRFNLATQLAEEYDVEGVVVSRTNGLRASAPYLFVGRFEGGDSIRGVLAPSPHREGQYFRKQIAAVIGQTQWDWRIGMNRHLMLRVMENVQDLAAD